MSVAHTQKRKFSIDASEDEYVEYARPTFKQLKLVTAAPASMDSDMAMSDASYIPFPSLLTRRSNSSNSLNTSSSALPSPNYTLASLQYPTTPSTSYPTFDLYPEVEIGMDVDMDCHTAQPRHHHSPSTESTDSHLGLLQPTSGSTALRHGGNCTQIPRLRLSSHAGLNGTRTLWSHCESCGAIEMVKA